MFKTRKHLDKYILLAQPKEDSKMPVHNGYPFKLTIICNHQKNCWYFTSGKVFDNIQALLYDYYGV